MPDVLFGEQENSLPDSKLIVLGLAIGYPNWDDSVTQFQSEREPLERVVKWYGFD